MALRRRRTVAWLAIAMVWLGLSTRAQDIQKFRGRLSPVPIDVSALTVIAGSGSAAAELAGTKLSITGTFERLRSPATLARVHNGPRGIRGPAVFDVSVSKATNGTISGSFALTPAQVEDLKAGRFYLQIHSEKAPDGNLWGWLLPEERRP